MGGAGKGSAPADRSKVESETDEGRPGALRGTVGTGRVGKRPLPKVIKVFKVIRDAKRHVRDNSDQVPLLQDEERPASSESRSTDDDASSTALAYHRNSAEPSLDTSAHDTSSSSYFKYTSFGDGDRHPQCHPALHRADRDRAATDAVNSTARQFADRDRASDVATDAVNSTGREFTDRSSPAAPLPDPASLRPCSSQCVVALDCEMVGVLNTNNTGKKRKAIETSALGRCSIVSYNGAVLFDEYVRPEGKIRSFRTRWSGIAPRHMKLAIPYREAVHRIKSLLKGCTVVGHALTNDFAVIDHMTHPKKMIRDTANFVPLRRAAGLCPGSQPKLKWLCKRLLGRDIQVGSHSSLEDARASLDLYRRYEDVWEEALGQGQQNSRWLSDTYWPKDINNAKNP